MADSPPLSDLLLSECPEFKAYLTAVEPSQLTTTDVKEDIDFEDEIVYEFLSSARGASSEDAEGALWELIEAEAEALELAEQDEDELWKNERRQNKISPSIPISKTIEKKPDVLTMKTDDEPKVKNGRSLNIAALMDCAAVELDRLRVGFSALSRSADISHSSPPSAATAPAPPAPAVLRQKSSSLAAQNPEERTTSTTGTLASLLHIQLAQLEKMNDCVRRDFENKLAHEKALLELLEMEYDRVQREVRQQDQRWIDHPSSDLTNQMRHLKDRLEQQNTLIDDLEYQYLEDKTKYEEEKENLLAQLRLHEESPSLRSTCDTPNTRSPTANWEPSKTDDYERPHFDDDESVPKNRDINRSMSKQNSISTPFATGQLDSDPRSSSSPEYSSPPQSSVSTVHPGTSTPTRLSPTNKNIPGVPVQPARNSSLKHHVSPVNQPHNPQSSQVNQFSRSKVSSIYSIPNSSSSGVPISQSAFFPPSNDTFQQQPNHHWTPMQLPTRSFQSSSNHQEPPEVQVHNNTFCYAGRWYDVGDANGIAQNGNSHAESFGPPNSMQMQPPRDLDSSFPSSSSSLMMQGASCMNPIYAAHCTSQQLQPMSTVMPELDQPPTYQRSFSSGVVKNGKDRGSLDSGYPYTNHFEQGEGTLSAGALSVPEQQQLQRQETPNSPCSSNSSFGVQPQIRNRLSPSPPITDRQIFHAVPPLPPQASPFHYPPPNASLLRKKPNGNITLPRQAWQEARGRPLSRYLPVPDDVTFDLRNHLESICGHQLSLLASQLNADTTCCSGYLYKLDSLLSDNSVSRPTSPGAGFVSPPTLRRHGGANRSRVVSPNGLGSALNFFRRRNKRRRWFVLDRRRRLLTYYSAQSTPTNPQKPKDVISFTDILDVYPDHQIKQGSAKFSSSSASSNFCLLLIANPNETVVSAHHASADLKNAPTKTRLMYLAAPSPEAMRVWVDALFTCAGAYLCLPNALAPP